jgi:MEMO1 family protein
MALVFAAIMPHTPLLLSHVGTKEKYQLPKTHTACQLLAEDLYAARVDTLIIISAHAGEHEEHYSIAGAPELRVSLTAFGDLRDYPLLKNDLVFVARLRERCKRQSIPLATLAPSTLDYASAIPAHILRSGLRFNRVVVIGTSGLSPKEHYEFGYVIKDMLLASTTRYGVVLSTHLSHTLHTDAFFGFHKSGDQFDTEVRERLQDYNTSRLLSMDQATAEDAEQYALQPLLLFLGMLQHMHYRYRELAYEHPMGAGYLTAQCLF